MKAVWIALYSLIVLIDLTAAFLNTLQGKWVLTAIFILLALWMGWLLRKEIVNK